MKFRKMVVSTLLFVFLIMLNACSTYCRVDFYDGDNLITSLNIEKNRVIGDVEEIKKTGYTLDGWYFDDEKWDFQNDIVQADMVLYAKWSLNKYKITFNLNGGEGEKELFFNYNEEIILPENPTKEGYTFVSWDKELPKNMPDSNIELTAIWEANACKITFDLDGGEGLKELYINVNDKIIIPFKPKKQGYTFVGWDKEIPETMPASGLTLKAQWKINQYTITFNTDGGSELASITQDYNSVISIPNDPTKEGYAFIGWDKQVPEFMPDYNINLTAQWKEITYKITFDLDGGEGLNELNFSKNQTIVIPNEPIKIGYTFVGWDKQVPETMPAHDIELIAKWKINSYKLIFDLDGGEGEKELEFDYNEEIVLPNDPVKNDYVFVGWNEIVPNNMPAEDIILKAVYSHNAIGTQYNLYVNSDCTANVGDEIEINGKLLIFGSSLFADLQSTFDAAKNFREMNESVLINIHLYNGNYKGGILKTSYVNIFGPNANIDPNNSNRYKEATIVSSLVVKGDNVTINGLAFDLEGQIKANELGGVDNLKIEFCNFLPTSSFNSAYSGRIELIWCREYNKETRAYDFVNTASCIDYSNLVVNNCRFESNNRRLQNIYGMQLNGLIVTNNVFIGASNGIYDDCIKFIDFITYSIKGNILVQNNSFNRIGQYTIWFRDYGPCNITIKNNKFNNIGLADGGLIYNRGALTITEPVIDLFENDDKLIIDFLKNEVIDACLGVRVGYEGLKANQVIVNVNYNIFEEITKTDRIIYNNNKNPIDETNFAAIDASNNYYDIPVSIENFNGIISWEPVLQNREDALK